ncbi:MAG: dihydrofolate reductase, partial [Lachnospiraceae bacterium]|nr:dihydrofolate reductase [Lachnospiraceae bacterium]
DKTYKPNGVIVADSVEAALEEAKKYHPKEIFVIGGESIYRQFMPYADTAYITYIDYTYQADRYMPNLDAEVDWKLVDESEEQTYFNVEYYYRTYKKI